MGFESQGYFEFGIGQYFCKESNLRMISKGYLLAVLVTLLVFIRLLFSTPPFSFDYFAYLTIIHGLGGLTFHEILVQKLNFPYVVTGLFTPIEFGFSLFVKLISAFGFNPETALSLIAALSVGLRVFVMYKLRVPMLWIVCINVFAITLLEANALRLGLASSVLLFGLLQWSRQRRIAAITLMGLSVTIHLQVMLFLAPFFLAKLFLKWISLSRFNRMVALFGLLIISLSAFELLNLVDIPKIQEYIARGGSESAGISITSILALFLIVCTVILIKGNDKIYTDSSMFQLVIFACTPSVFALIFLTNVAVIGDRAWQLAFLIFSSFIFTNWSSRKSKRIVLFIFIMLLSVMQINVLIRYPLSNFFSPPFPSIEYYKGPD